MCNATHHRRAACFSIKTIVFSSYFVHMFLTCLPFLRSSTHFLLESMIAIFSEILLKMVLISILCPKWHTHCAHSIQNKMTSILYNLNNSFVFFSITDFWFWLISLFYLEYTIGNYGRSRSEKKPSQLLLLATK